MIQIHQGLGQKNSVLELAKRIFQWSMVGSTELEKCFSCHQKLLMTNGQVGHFSKVFTWQEESLITNDR
jgi:hypothetical protein